MDKIVIKRHQSGNDYLLTDTGHWVRNFTKSVRPVDINALVTQRDYGLILENQMRNASMNIANIDAEAIYANNVIVVSDGYKFQERQSLLANLPPGKVTIIGANRSLAKWDMKTKMDYYVVNNPYAECMSYFPKSYFPRCIASVRTNPEFIRKYISRRGVMYKYIPVSDDKFSSSTHPPIYHIDDYRNPICAAIGLAHRWEVQKLLLFCCDDVFESERPAAQQLPNGLWLYPQHLLSHELILGNLFWLANNNVKLGNFSSGPDYKHIPYIKEDEIVKFFED